MDAVGVTATYGGRDWTLLELADDWSARVLKFFEDSKIPAQGDNDSVWTIHDLIGAMYLRDAIEKALVLHGGAGTTAPPSIAATDAFFASFTQDDPAELVAIIDPDSQRDGWWWRRLPTSGPVAREAQQIATRLR